MGLLVAKEIASVTLGTAGYAAKKQRASLGIFRQCAIVADDTACGGRFGGADNLTGVWVFRQGSGALRACVHGDIFWQGDLDVDAYCDPGA